MRGGSLADTCIGPVCVQLGSKLTPCPVAGFQPGTLLRRTGSGLNFGAFVAQLQGNAVAVLQRWYENDSACPEE